MTDYSKQLAEELGWSELFAHGMERGVPTLWAKCVALLEASAEKDARIADILQTLDGQLLEVQRLAKECAEKDATIAELRKQVSEHLKWVLGDALKKHEMGLSTHGDGIFYNKRAEAAETENAELRERVKELEGAIPKGHVLQRHLYGMGAGEKEKA